MQQASAAVRILKWEMLEACHEKLIDAIGKVKLAGIFSAITKTGMYLALEYADFKCQNCPSQDRLTLQHLVRKTDEKFMDANRALKAKNHWRNLIVLCPPCHVEADKMFGNGNEDKMLSIPKDRIEEIKKYFYTIESGDPGHIPRDVVRDVMQNIVENDINQTIKPIL